MLSTKIHSFLEFSKSLYKTSLTMQHFHYQIIFGVKCNSKWRQTDKENLQSVTISILGYLGEFRILGQMQGENANKIPYFYKAMVMSYISVSEFWVFLHQDTLETKIKS